MAILNDPNNTRKIKTVPLPYRTSLSEEVLFQFGKVNIRLLMDFFVREGKLTQEILIKILHKAKAILELQPNLLSIKSPVTIIGDIHGQYYDLVKMLETKIIPPINESKYLFLGDYVDRGKFSIQVMLLILSYKINYPKKVFLLRGNHQCRQLTNHFNFRSQCLHKYSQQIYSLFVELFDTLPLAALVNNSFLCLHGGISQNIQTIENIKEIDRFVQIPQDGSFCDIVWADPIDNDEGQLIQLTQHNESRGCSYYFGSEFIKKFIDKNKVLGIIRGHEAKQQGFQMHKWFGNYKFPPVITVFSAPNYANFYNNKGAVIKIMKQDVQICQVEGNQNPYHLPDNLNLFEWSIPFVTQKILEMFEYLIGAEQYRKEKKQSDNVLVEFVDKRTIIEELRQLQNYGKDQERTKRIKQHNLGKQFAFNQEALQYYLNSAKDFNKEKNIDKMNERRPSSSTDVQ